MGINYANRGTHLEELVLLASSQYQKKGLARIDKFPTPIAPERVTRDGKVYGHYAQKSTVDYIGTIKSGVSVCFDCKETADTNKFPMSNVHQHQIEYLKNVHTMGGISFLIVCFTKTGKYFRLDFQELYEYWQIYEKAAGTGKRPAGTANIPYVIFKNELISEKGICLHFLMGIVD